MITINSEKGEMFSYDPSTGRVFKDGFLVPSTEVEPIFSSIDSEITPKFSGLYLKELNMILSLSGKYSQLSNPNTII